MTNDPTNTPLSQMRLAQARNMLRGHLDGLFESEDWDYLLEEWAQMDIDAPEDHLSDDDLDDKILELEMHEARLEHHLLGHALFFLAEALGERQAHLDQVTETIRLRQISNQYRRELGTATEVDRASEVDRAHKLAEAREAAMKRWRS